MYGRAFGSRNSQLIVVAVIVKTECSRHCISPRLVLVELTRIPKPLRDFVKLCGLTVLGEREKRTESLSQVVLRLAIIYRS